MQLKKLPSTHQLGSPLNHASIQLLPADGARDDDVYPSGKRLVHRKHLTFEMCVECYCGFIGWYVVKKESGFVCIQICLISVEYWSWNYQQICTPTLLSERTTSYWRIDYPKGTLIAYTDVYRNCFQVGFHSSLLLLNICHLGQYCELGHDKVCKVCDELMLVLSLLLLSFLMFIFILMLMLLFKLMLTSLLLFWCRRHLMGGTRFDRSLTSLCWCCCFLWCCC